MRKVIISQPMFLPWIGLFEQIKLSDIYVHFDDVQFPLGRSFINRVQIKTKDGIQWLTIPVKRKGIQRINQVEIDNSKNWKIKHIKKIKHAYSNTPYFDEMSTLIEEIYSLETDFLAKFNVNAIEKICNYFSIGKEFRFSSNIENNFNSTEKILDIVKKMDGKIYITGHGARNYLKHELFENKEIRVEYMKYELNKYNQQYGNFIPYVSIIDLIANVGKNGEKLMSSQTQYWREFINESNIKV